MRRALAVIFTALALVLLCQIGWQSGFIRQYHSPCPPRTFPCSTNGIIEEAEAKAPAAITTAPPREEPPDLRILCKAIAVAETSNCTTGTALSYNNCHGLTKRNGSGVTVFQRFDSFEESFAMCEWQWNHSYHRFPDLTLAAKWSSPEAAEGWLKNVTVAYRSLQR